MLSELYQIFRRNFPFIVRDEATALRILGHEGNKVLEKRNPQGELIGAAVVNDHTLLMLCVDAPYRRQGLGEELLALSERAVRDGGHDEITVGVGFDYLMPGVPTSRPYFATEEPRLCDGLTDAAARFFEARGYRHAWDCDCFDMRFPLLEFPDTPLDPGCAADGVTYRWAAPEDLDAVRDCVYDACEEFTPYYLSPALYEGDSPERALIAVCGRQVVGALLVSVEAEGAGLGSVGCTAVRPAYRGRRIATNLVKLGTAYLRERGMAEAYLSYTYTGLDRMYGQAGYRICVYYMMAKKRL